MPAYAPGLIPEVQAKPYNYKKLKYILFKKITTITDVYEFFGHFGIQLAFTKCKRVGGDHFAEKNPIYYPDIALAYRHFCHFCCRCFRDTF
jgi:hypothetical protein